MWEFEKKDFDRWDEFVDKAAEKGVLLKYGSSHSLRGAGRFELQE
jgi:hypothetical protein